MKKTSSMSLLTVVLGTVGLLLLVFYIVMGIAGTYSYEHGRALRYAFVLVLLLQLLFVPRANSKNSPTAVATQMVALASMFVWTAVATYLGARDFFHWQWIATSAGTFPPSLCALFALGVGLSQVRSWKQRRAHRAV